MVQGQDLAIRHFIRHLRQASVSRILCLRPKGFSQRQRGVRVGVSERVTGQPEVINLLF